MILGMTGSRDGMSEFAMSKLIEFLDTHRVSEAHHGDCIGADEEFHEQCESRNIPIVVHPPLNGSMRAYKPSSKILEPKGYLKRNKNIVDASDFIIAFPSTHTEVLRSGTWATIRYAKKQKKPILIIYPTTDYRGRNSPRD